MNNHKVLFLAAFLLLPVLTMARPWTVGKDVGFDLIYAVGYDNNILEMSYRDKDRFLNNNLPGPTSPHSYDALTQNIGAKFKIASPRFIGKRRARLYYTLTYYSYAENSFNDRISHSLFFLQDLAKRVDFVGSYYYSPNRYLRDYYDRDFGEFRGTEFDYYYGTAGIRMSPIKKLRVDLRYEDFQVYYNSRFTEYDSEGSGIRFEMRYSMSKSIDLNLSIRKRWADNVGYDESSGFAASDPSIDDEYGDSSYGEEWLEYGISWSKLPLFGKSVEMDISHRLRHRYYTSELSIEDDPFHRSREHVQQRFMVEFSTELLEGFMIGPEIDFEFRRSESPVDAVIDAKDFDALRFMLNIEYSIYGR